MKKSMLHFGLLLCFLFLTACAKTEIVPTITNKLIDNVNHHIYVTETPTSFQLTIEVLSDTTNNLGGAFPAADLINLGIDVNQNGSVDSYTDIGFSNVPNSSESLCSYYFLGEDDLSACGDYVTGASIKGLFESSESMQTPHIIWIFKFPKQEFNLLQELDFVLKIYSNYQYSSYPAHTEWGTFPKISFDRVLSYSWEMN